MPVLNIHLLGGAHAPEKIEELLVRCSQLFAEVLKAPVARVRVFATEYPPGRACIGGRIATAEGPSAPYFSFIVMEDRPTADRQRLLAGFTDLIVDILGVERSLVRGGIVPVAAADWAIGGQPASILRQAEIAARNPAAGGA